MLENGARVVSKPDWQRKTPLLQGILVWVAGSGSGSGKTGLERLDAAETDSTTWTWCLAGFITRAGVKAAADTAADARLLPERELCVTRILRLDAQLPST